jgi:hypothetical protein
VTDRELLELAAKAEGHGVEFDDVSGLTWYESRFTQLLWNPLHNDGDAMRLAAKLRIDVNHGGTLVVAEQVKPHDTGCAEPHGSDPWAATRRAIVRAAAEIGKEADK